MSYYKLLLDISEVPDDIKKTYIEKVKIINNNLNAGSDSGFDLFSIQDQKIDCKSISNKINLKVKCCMLNSLGLSTGFFLCPRSSCGSKTPLRLSNSLGIIDAGYRGNLIAFVDNADYKDYNIKKNDRLFQILAPTLLPIKIEIVDCLNITQRGIKGFGSTGK